MFGQYKNNKITFLIENYSNKDQFNKEFKTFIKQLHSDDVLREAFICYVNVENTKFDDIQKAQFFLNENINTLEKLEYRIRKRLKPLIKESKSDNSIATSLDKLVFSKLNTSKKIELKSQILEHMLTKKEETLTEDIDLKNINLPLKFMANVFAEKFNKEYETLEESDSKILKAILNEDNETLKNILKENISEIKLMIETFLSKGENSDLSKKLVLISGKLNSMDFEKINLKEEVLNIIDLKETLNETIK